MQWFTYTFQLKSFVRAEPKPYCPPFRLNQPVQVLVAAIHEDRLYQPVRDRDLLLDDSDLLHGATTGSRDQNQEDTNKQGDQPIQEAGQGPHIIGATAMRRMVRGRLDQPTIHRSGVQLLRGARDGTMSAEIQTDCPHTTIIHAARTKVKKGGARSGLETMI